MATGLYIECQLQLHVCILSAAELSQDLSINYDGEGGCGGSGGGGGGGGGDDDDSEEEEGTYMHRLCIYKITIPGVFPIH